MRVWVAYFIIYRHVNTSLDTEDQEGPGQPPPTINLGKVSKHLGPSAPLLTGSALREAMSLACAKSVLSIPA
jgi:hypothetical protein